MRLIKAAEGAGVSAIAIHARHISDRPRNPARVTHDDHISIIDVTRRT
jgi:tRNA-dihydrouridine synthase